MKKIGIILALSIFTSCSEISQKVIYDQNTRLSVETYTNGSFTHTYEDFDIIQQVEPNQIDSVKKLQREIAEEYLRLAK